MSSFWSRSPLPAVALAAMVLGGCRGDAPAEGAAAAMQAQPQSEHFGVYRVERPMSREELERGRLSGGWRRVVQLDSIPGTDTLANPEQWEQISARRVNAAPIHLPLSGNVAGPSVLRVQILLDRAIFSPGSIDGRWGDNTEKAVYWMQKRERLPATGRVDRRTFERLVQLAGNPRQLAREHRLTAEDVEGPFVQIPEDIYEKAKLDCLCYESLAEKLGEKFHSTPELLAQLNGGIDLNTLRAGQSIQVPVVRDENSAPAGDVAKIVVSDAGSYVHGVDA
ncbi:MAG: peptidoglycan-binding protein, partial [Gemmatimonadota bacterium]|nr:peptidoglycan-binding protein [Gemmatimonadota bacterium]